MVLLGSSISDEAFRLLRNSYLPGYPTPRNRVAEVFGG
jgi:hypothetical protein